MNPSKSGLSSAAKTGIVVVLVVLVLGVAYVSPSLLKGGTSSSAQSEVCSGSAGGSQNIGLLTLFRCFSQMQMQASLNTLNQPGGNFQSQTLAYVVLGTATLNSTPHTKVEFTVVGSGNDVVAWFNSTGGIDRLDVIGQRNYTGPGAPILAQSYTAGFGLIPVISNNATLLSMLSQTTENTTSIGPTMLNVTTYHLPVPTSVYKSITAKYATIPGTNLRLVVYLDQKTRDGTETTIQVQSVTR
jgi:hypothetical protein